MKIEIEYKEKDDLPSMVILDDESKITKWTDLTKNQQIKVVKNLCNFYKLYYNFIKQ